MNAVRVVTDSSEELFQCLTQRQSFTELNTGVEIVPHKWVERHETDHEDANGGQHKLNMKHGFTEEIIEEPRIQVPNLNSKSSMEDLHNTARAQALSSILAQDKSFSSIEKANLLRDTSLTSLSSRVVEQHKKTEKAEKVARENEGSVSSNCYGVTPIQKQRQAPT